MTTVIRAEDLGKKYLIHHEQQGQRFRYDSLSESLANSGKAFCRRLLHPFSPHSKMHSQEEFWALRDINFEIQQGDRVGIIGRNGAGKSTLLKILSRITKPTTGKVTIKGKVASLLEVGTGFHPELTGRENIYLNGAILGMKRREINKKFDEIVAFAEVDKFLDTPVKHYSSGMYVRLAFAVAAHLEPDILVVDEVLAVGDARFQDKCISKMDSLGNSGNTIIFVSHNIPTILHLASTGMVIFEGHIHAYNSIDIIVKQYLLSSNQSVSASEWNKFEGDDNIGVTHISISQNNPREPFLTNLSIQVNIDLIVYIETKDIVVGCNLMNLYGVNLAYSAQHDNQSLGLPTKLLPGKYRFVFEIPENTLAEGCYKIVADLGIHNKKRIVEQASVIFNIVNIDGLGHYFRAEGKHFNHVFRPDWRWTFQNLE